MKEPLSGAFESISKGYSAIGQGQKSLIEMVSGPPQTMQIMKAKRTFIPTFPLWVRVFQVLTGQTFSFLFCFILGQANSNQAILLSIKLWPQRRREDCQHFAVILSLATHKQQPLR